MPEMFEKSHSFCFGDELKDPLWNVLRKEIEQKLCAVKGIGGLNYGADHSKKSVHSRRAIRTDAPPQFLLSPGSSSLKVIVPMHLVGQKKILDLTPAAVETFPNTKIPWVKTDEMVTTISMNLVLKISLDISGCPGAVSDLGIRATGEGEIQDIEFVEASATDAAAAAVTQANFLAEIFGPAMEKNPMFKALGFKQRNLAQLTKDLISARAEKYEQKIKDKVYAKIDVKTEVKLVLALHPQLDPVDSRSIASCKIEFTGVDNGELVTYCPCRPNQSPLSSHPWLPSGAHHHDSLRAVEAIPINMPVVSFLDTTNGEPGPDDYVFGATKWEVSGQVYLGDGAKPIGRGAFGNVYKAYSGDGITAAIKVVHLQQVFSVERKTRREIAFLQKFPHPNIVCYLGSRFYRNVCILVLEYLERSLKDVLRVHGRQPLPMIGKVMAQIISAVCYIHEKAIVHHDIKPGNVMFNAAGVPKLVDFNASNNAHADQCQTALVGTKAYAPPEYGRYSVIDPRQRLKFDVWSLGIVSLEMFTALAPTDLGPNATFENLTKGIPFDPTDEVFRSFLGECIEPNVQKRADSAALMGSPFILSCSTC